MNALEFARLQFAVTTLFHYIFVPLSIGLALWVALCQTRWYRTGDEVYLRMTRFWGKFFLISMAIGVVTGIVQEFQFGMNWSLYSRYVGDIFGAPLAMEGLMAFFLESTFVGLWIFGWGKLSPRLHLMTIWLTAFGTALSAYFILAANSWMQHPVGYRIDQATGKAELTNIFQVLFDDTTTVAFAHTVLAAFTDGAMFVVAVSALLMLRGQGSKLISRSMRWALPLTLITVVATMGFGDGQGRIMLSQQPMKMVAAEDIYTTGHGQGFSLLSLGTFKTNPGLHGTTSLRIPHLLSLVEDLSWNGTSKGIDQLQTLYRAKYGPGNYVPPVGVEYWSFRLMVGAGILMFLIPLVGLWLLRRRRLESSLWFQRAALLGIGLPVVANWCGWIFTELGRQPWVVFGLLKTNVANSPDVSELDVMLTLAGYVVIYGVLIAVGAWLMWRECRQGPEPDPDPGPPTSPANDRSHDLAMAY
jgi:cytochrome d ubiquinol oxidase subunit I